MVPLGQPLKFIARSSKVMPFLFAETAVNIIQHSFLNILKDLDDLRMCTTHNVKQPHYSPLV